MQIHEDSKGAGRGARSGIDRPRTAARLRRIPVVLIAVLVHGLTGCGSEPAEPARGRAGEHQEHAAEAEAPGHDEHGPGEEIRIPPGVQRRFGISTAPAAPGPVEVTLDLPGEVVPDPGRIVHVRPPFAGTIQRVFKHVGDTVEEGDALAFLVSAKALAPYTIEAGIAGTITTEHAAVGEFVDAAHELFTIVDTSTVWVQFQVFPNDLSRVHVGDRVEILKPNADRGAFGDISFITPVLDHATRTATARVVLTNHGASPYQPGLFVTGRVAVARKEAALSVSTSALVREARGWVVFVREGEERFVRRPVQVGHRGIERSEIIRGLQVGEEIVRDGAFLVNSAAARREMGGETRSLTDREET